jgi:GT2 family glycosyltransferase
MSEVSIIIPVFNQNFLTKQCLDILLGLSYYAAPPEIIVVNDGSDEATARMLSGYGDRIRVVTHERNQGFAVSCNDGAAVAKGHHLVFLNNDTIPLSGWLDAMVAYVEARSRAAVVGSKLLFPNGTIQHCGIVICSDRLPRHLYISFPGDCPAVNSSRRFQVVTGACFLIRREVFETLSGFDTTFVNGFEDVDLCLRVGELGYEVHYCHESELYHLASMSEGRTNNDSRNERLYLERWGDRVQPDDWIYYLRDGLIRIEYGAYTPLKFTLSPLLGIVTDQDGNASEAERLLALRAQQVNLFMRENLHLRMALSHPSAD